MTGNAPTFATLFLRVFLPFALAYFLSYIFRGVNAVIFPYLERDIGITAGDLGLLTSAFFLFFAGCQPVLGVMLDRYGPRRVQVVLLAMAAAGSALFGLSLSLGELIVARVLIGLGFAGGLMAAIKAITLWYPPQRWGLITGFHMMAGGLGSMAATLPVEWSLSVVSWQGLFFWLAGFCLATSAILFIVVPERAGPRAAGTLAEQFRITGTVLTDGFYWRIQPLLAIQQLAFIGCISLWIGPWLRDVGGFTDKEMRADIQLYTAAATTLGFAMSGVIANGLHRVGVSNFASAGLMSILFAIVCGWIAFVPSFHPATAWIAFGFLGACPIQYMPLMVASFPAHYAGRVSTSSNLVVFSVIFAGQWAIGKIVDQWPRTATGYSPDGYSWAFGALFILQLAGLAWLLLSRAQPMVRPHLVAAD
ncbi:MFS transporter [Reyranella soli]|uniref:MFS transporter n=1 Tax=Reyranella soli TaxID=1230389 RepID=A0A512N4S9_9HYPH|nr:MFS transporter [Reyranella soli]GEP53963.1 MFS transporter [Reyranella soli]